MKLRHVRVPRTNALDERLLQAFDRVPQMQLAKRRRDFERACAYSVGGVAITTICANKCLAPLFAWRHLRDRNAWQCQVKRHHEIGQSRVMLLASCQESLQTVAFFEIRHSSAAMPCGCGARSGASLAAQLPRCFQGLSMCGKPFQWSVRDSRRYPAGTLEVRPRWRI